MDARQQFFPTMSRVLLAMLASAVVAVAVVTMAAVILWPAYDSRLAVLLNFLLFGTIIAFPLAFALGLPAYYLFRRMGRVTRPLALVAGAALALVVPVVLAGMNGPGLITWGELLICATAGALASLVFCSILGIGRAPDSL